MEIFTLIDMPDVGKLLPSRESFPDKLNIGFPFIIKVWDRDSDCDTRPASLLKVNKTLGRPKPCC